MKRHYEKIIDVLFIIFMLTCITLLAGTMGILMVHYFIRDIL